MDAVLSNLLFGVGITILPFGFMYVFIRLQIHVYAVKVNAATSKGIKSGLDLLFFRPRKFWLICKAAFSTDIKLRQAAVELLYPQYAERLEQMRAEYREKLQKVIDAVNEYAGVGDKYQVELLNRRFKPADLHPDMVRVSFLDETIPAEAVDAITAVINANFDGFDRTQFDRVAIELPDGRSGTGCRLTILGPQLP